MQVTVTGTERLASLREALTRWPEEAVKRSILNLEANKEMILDRGRATIKTHVYDVYDPSEYERSENLMKALSMKTEGTSVIAYISGQWLKNAPNDFKTRRKIKPFDYQWSVDRGFGWFWGSYPWSGPRPYAYFLRAEILATAKLKIAEAADQVTRELTRGGK